MEIELHRKSQRSHTTHCTTDYVILQHGGLDIVYTRMWMSDCSAKKRAKAGIWKGRQKGQKEEHAGTNEQIFCSSTKVNPTHGPSAPPQHRPPCSSCPTSVRTPRATSAQRERRRGNRRAVRGLEKASRNRRTEALKPRQSTIGAPRWAKIRTMPFIWQATAATRVQEERQGRERRRIKILS